MRETEQRKVGVQEREKRTAGVQKAGMQETGEGKFEDVGSARTGIARLRGRTLSRIMAVLVLCIAVAALVERGGAVEWLFAAVVLAAFGGGLLLPYAALGRIHAERTVYAAERLVDGGEMRVMLSLKVSRMLPFIWVCLQDEIRNVCGTEDGVKVARVLLPGFSRELVLTYTLKSLQRGELAFPRVTVKAGDMLGLTVRTVTVDCPGQVFVKPAQPPGEQIGELPGFETGSVRQGRQSVSLFGGQMMAAASRLRRDGAGAELRAYAPGDSLRRVDWRAMARGLGMQTRMDEAEEVSTVFILLETSAAAYGRNRRLFDANAGRALAIMRQAEREGKRVRLLTNSLQPLGGSDGRGEGAALLEQEKRLARLRLSTIFTPMSECLSDAVAGAPRGAAVICLTAGTTGGAEVIARQSDNPGNISYAAKLAGVRGVKLMLLLSLPAYGAAEAEKSWQVLLQGTGCFVKALPMSESYSSMKPSTKEAAIRSGGEGSATHVETANR